MAYQTGQPLVTSKYYSGQGRCMMAERDPLNGLPKGLLPIGNVPALTIGIAETTEDHKESWSGSRAVDDTTVTETVVNVTITMESFDPVNLALGLKGTSTLEAAAVAPVSALVKLYKGKWTALPHVNIAALAVGTGGTPGDLADTMLIVDEANGLVQLDSTATTTYVDGADVELEYTHGAQVDVQAMTTTINQERYFVFSGLNTKDGKAVRLVVPRLQIQPFTELGKIGDTIAQVELTCRALPDPFLASTPGVSAFFSEKYES